MNAMTNKDIKGLAVISIAEGEKLGTISRVYLDPSAKKIVGFSVDPGGSVLDPDSTKLIDVDDLHTLGPDALTLNDKTGVRGDQINANYGSLLSLDDLEKRKVVTEGGEMVGQIASTQFDPSSFQLTGIEVSPGFFKSNKLIPIDQVTTIGPELVIVSNAVCASPGEPAETGAATETGGGWVVGDVPVARSSASPSGGNS